MIETTLSKQQAEALFAREAILLGTGMFITRNNESVPMHRIGELFGVEMMEWFETGTHNHFKGGEDYNIIGGGSDGSPFIHIVYHDGFMNIVCRHNRKLVAQAHKTSEAGRQWDLIEAAAQARLDALDAEEDRKREERKAKRAAARKAKLEAQKATEGVQHEDIQKA